MPSDEFEKLLIESINSNLSPHVSNDADTLTSEFQSDHTIWTLDTDDTDFLTLKEILKNQYLLVQADGLITELETISKKERLPCAVILSISEHSVAGQIADIIRQCNFYDVPVITIHDSQYLISDCVALGIADAIMRPYSSEVLPNRIKNAICTTQFFKFQKEKEVSSAIIEMKRRAEKDSLTGLLNRLEFEIRIQDFFNYNKNCDGIFIIFDVDRFKNINDTMGHSAGDKVICAVAAMLHDTFSETNLISRIGGDEFALFIPYRLAQAEVEKKLVKICGTFAVEIGTMQVSCSAGMCCSPEHGIDYESLYRNADIALLNAKQNGKSRYVVYSDGMSTPSFSPLENKATALLNDVSDAMFVCDALTNEIIYINNTACKIVNKNKSACIGARCYELFWNSCRNCDRCFSIDGHTDNYYEEDTVLKDEKTPVHVKAKLGEWDGKKVKIHYLQGI